jgi:hypothetical protein
MTRIWNTPFFILATVYFVVDGVFSYVTQPVTAWIAKKKPFQRARMVRCGLTRRWPFSPFLSFSWSPPSHSLGI